MFHEIHIGSWLLIPAAVLFVAWCFACCVVDGCFSKKSTQLAKSTAELTDEEMSAIRAARTPAEHDYDYEPEDSKT
jgi:hypothetical protein